MTKSKDELVVELLDKVIMRAKNAGYLSTLYVISTGIEVSALGKTAKLQKTQSEDAEIALMEAKAELLSALEI